MSREIRVSVIMRLSAACMAAALLVACSGGGGGLQSGPNPNSAPVPFRVETFLPNANFPVTLAFAPDGRLFFNELQTGRVRIVQNGQLLAQPFVTLTVEQSGERGLLGLAFDPNFAANRFVYVYYSDPGGFHRLLRFTDSNNVGTNQTTIFTVAASNSNHNGGNIAFGPDGRIYITVGDCGNPANSQSMTSACGKILRINSNGTIPADNPF
ncbi:MAG: PQQ-dependent sugar dehydrogenase [Candidatus Binataceae bacterium]